MKEGQSPPVRLPVVLQMAGWGTHLKFIRRENMKKVLSIALALLLVLGLTAVAKPASADATEITLWTYPIGEWGK